VRVCKKLFRGLVILSFPRGATPPLFFFLFLFFFSFLLLPPKKDHNQEFSRGR